MSKLCTVLVCSFSWVRRFHRWSLLVLENGCVCCNLGENNICRILRTSICNFRYKRGHFSHVVVHAHVIAQGRIIGHPTTSGGSVWTKGFLIRATFDLDSPLDREWYLQFRLMRAISCRNIGTSTLYRTLMHRRKKRVD